jgi:hypothetical protein
VRQSFTEYVKGYGAPLVHLEQWPIESVTSVAEDRGASVLRCGPVGAARRCSKSRFRQGQHACNLRSSTVSPRSFS